MSAGATATTGVLSGFRIAVTSQRRSVELIEALERRGAQVLHAPALATAPLQGEAELLGSTRRVLELHPDDVLVCTAYGFRRWFESAEAAGMGEELAAVLHASRIHVRGPKALGAVRALGFDAESVAADELTGTLVAGLAPGLAGKSVVLQHHGHPDTEATAALLAAGATEVVGISPYRWVAPEEPGKLEVLLRALCSGSLDVLTFTSAPAVHALLDAARLHDCGDEVLAALQSTVCTVAVGPVTAAPLREVGIEPLVPERHRMGAMIRTLVEHLGTNGSIQCATALGNLSLRGATVHLEGAVRELGESQLRIFKSLVSAGGNVVARPALAALLPAGSSDHALDMAVSRLRRALPDARLISTVLKRGYRLNT
ncbi:uroporphyrinogen-III synthase [Arthrobacter sp. AQ5-05]|uniref:uroporphyrinogen-III synthase n=1 Tax=Arthrobacter sp. AQ5-05 TaxID=2184581 RepID=UPI000DCC194C|nr:uroporphyrinogen-III synthase [Arthrobacter sp. AQ5-05]RAX49365.1 uroporphyrinogen-III synthase [Arthrobacter sp. AQ5-05]